EPSCWPCGVVRLKRDFGVMKLVGNAAEIARNLVRTIQPATRNVEVPQIGDGRGQVGGALQPPRDVGPAAVGYDVRRWPMVARVPDWRDESVPQLTPGITCRAVRHAHKIAVVDPF